MLKASFTYSYSIMYYSLFPFLLVTKLVSVVFTNKRYCLHVEFNYFS